MPNKFNNVTPRPVRCAGIKSRPWPIITAKEEPKKPKENQKEQKEKIRERPRERPREKVAENNYFNWIKNYRVYFSL